VTHPCEAWVKCWRDGLAPLLPGAGLEALRLALAEDDPELLQGATTKPPPLACVREWPCEACCPVAYALWRGLGLATVGEVEEFWARLCFEADLALDEPAAVLWFLNWWDSVPRAEARRALLEEVSRELARRVEAPPTPRPADRQREAPGCPLRQPGASAFGARRQASPAEPGTEAGRSASGGFLAEPPFQKPDGSNPVGSVPMAML